MNQLREVSTLKTQPEVEREKVEKLMQEFFGANKKGQVRGVLFAYVDDTGATNYAVSGNMSIRNFAYCLAVLQWRLNGWIERS